MPRKSNKLALAALARRLAAGEIDDATYDLEVDRLLGSGLPDRDPEAEAAFEEGVRYQGQFTPRKK